jgi:thioredoxin reductase
VPEFDLIVIGGGAAGFGAAIKANDLGAKTAFVHAGLPLFDASVKFTSESPAHAVVPPDGHKGRYLVSAQPTQPAVTCRSGCAPQKLPREYGGPQHTCRAGQR